MERSAINKRDLYYKTANPKSMLLCAKCKAAGLTKKDAEKYDCTSCGQAMGRTRFSAKVMHNKQKGQNTKLECMECEKKMAERLKVLEKNLKKSKRICTCYQLLHAEKCPLTPCYSGEQRWPGSDGYINRIDRDFLNNRCPRPKWWWRAWGRR